MSTGSWFKAHRKQVITHTLIVGGFLLFLLFLSEPLFDRLGRVVGESRLYETPLPAATNNIRYHIDHFKADAHTLGIDGWTFIKGHDSVNSATYIVLKSADRMYIFTTDTVIREDVTRSFKELELNLDYSGFTALIPTRKIANGEYTVGIYIWKDDIEALMYTHIQTEL